MLAGAGTIAGAVTWPGAADSWVVGMLVAFSILPIVGGGFGALICGGKAQRQRLLVTGRDVVARWHVGAERWAQFLALEARLREGNGAVNVLSPRPSADGVEVVVGNNAVVVADEIHDFDWGIPVVTGANTLFGPPLCIEIRLLFDSDDSSDHQLRVLRFPVGAGGDAGAAKVLAHFVAVAARAANG